MIVIYNTFGLIKIKFVDNYFIVLNK